MEAKDFLKFQTQRKVIGLSKSFLMVLEDLIDEGYVIPADKFARLRKRTLDQGNDASREIGAIIDELNITF